MKDICITVFGDSIAYGAWDKDKGGWVSRLRSMLETNTDNFLHVYNLAIPGETSTGVNTQFNYEYGYRHHHLFHNIIIFAIGINDSLVGFGKNSVPREIFQKNIESLIEKAQKYTNKVIFVGLTRVDEDIIPQNLESSVYTESFINTEINEYDHILKITCDKHKIKYIDVQDILKTDELSDGLHPNEIGHQKLADKIYETIIEYI